MDMAVVKGRQYQRPFGVDMIRPGGRRFPHFP
jgi:hypothetical protein